MNVSEVIKTVMKDNKVTSLALSEKTGMSSSFIRDKIGTRCNMRVGAAYLILKGLECDIVIKDKIGDRKTYTVEPDEEQITNAADLIKEIMQSKGYSFRALADKLGCKTASYVSEKIYGKKQGMSFEWFLKILNGMDCEVLVVLDKQKWVIDG